MIEPWKIDIVAIRNTLRQIGNNSTSGNDEMALWVIVNLVFYTGLKLNEITELKERDVISNNNVVNQIVFSRQKLFSPRTPLNRLPSNPPVRQRSVQLPLLPNIQGLLSGYVQGFQSTAGSRITSASPLFPVYSGESGRKNLTRHLKRYHTNFVELRRAGVIYFNTECLRNDPDPDRRKAMDRAVAGTARHFQTTERTVEDYIRGIHRPPGRRKGETRTVDDRAADLLYGLRSTGYEIFVENKVRELIIEMEELFEDSVEAEEKDSVVTKKIDSTEAKTIYLEWLYDLVLDAYRRLLGIVAAKETKPVAIQKLEPPQSLLKFLLEEIRRPPSEQEKYDPEAERTHREEIEQLMIKNRPKYRDLDELKQMIFDLIEQGKGCLNDEKIEELKSHHDKYKKRKVGFG